MSEAPQDAARPPSMWRDVWAWVSALSVLPLLLATRGAPRGEAVAEDFDFLRRAMEPGISLLDGGGSLAFWRPVSHQLYYETFGSLILTSPEGIAAVHVALLGLAALLLYRALRASWPGPVAAAAASFPLMAESTRTLILWPSHFVDLGAFLFLALAYHELTRRRCWTASAALLAALLCKELALVGALLLPFAPGVGVMRGDRRRALLASGAVTLGWALAYTWVRGHAGLELPHGIERDPALLSTSLPTRLSWAVWNSLRATWGLAFERSHAMTLAVLALAIAAAAVAIARMPAARLRYRELRGAVLWGGAWALISWAALASIFPLWAPNRSQLGSVGFGIAATGAAYAVHPLLPAAVTATRLAMLAVAPHAPARITPEPEGHGAFLDYGKLCRLQRMMRSTREALKARFPSLPHGATIGLYAAPLSIEYAYGRAHALQAWYRDSTLSWITLQEFETRPAVPVLAFVGYQPRHDPQVVLLDGPAVHFALAGFAQLREGRWSESLASLRHAEAAQRDPRALVFRGDLAGRRAYCEAWLRQWDEAEREAAFAIGVAPEDVGARYVKALIHARHRDWAASSAELDTLLAVNPEHEEGLRLRLALDSLSVRASR